MQYPALGLEGYRWAPIRIGYDAQRSTRTEAMITPMHGDWVNYDTHRKLYLLTSKPLHKNSHGSEMQDATTTDN
jgi:hypothetical protein